MPLPAVGYADGLLVMGRVEEIRRFQDAVRVRIENAARDTGRSVREFPPAELLSLLCAAAFSAVLMATTGIAGTTGPAGPGGLLPPAGGVLGALLSGALDSMRARRHGFLPSPEDVESEIFWRIQQDLAAEDGHASKLRAEIAVAFKESDAIRSALLVAIETGNDQLRNDVIAVIATLSGEFAEMAFLLRDGDHEVAVLQGKLDGKGAEFRALGEMVRRRSADVRIVREDLAAISQRQSRAGRGEAADADHGPRWASGCPYLGLLPFDQARADVFCGRQRLTAELMVKVAGRLAGPAMIIVSGASGAGKSSLLHAGLLPALAAGRQLPGSECWPRVVMTPGSDPLTELATQLAAVSGGDTAAIRRQLADPGQAHLAVGQAVAGAIGRTGGQPPADGRPGRLVVLVDQFEEVFTLNPGGGQAGQQAFIAALCAAATGPSGPRGEPPALVVIAVRGDFWARCAAHSGLARMMQDGLFVVGPMTGPELRKAITGPAAVAGLEIDANLADIVLADLHTAGQEEAEGTLPLLSQAMMLTWGKREGNRLTVRGYNQTGGVARSVEFGAEAIYEALPDAGQQIAREIFQALALAGPDSQLARRPARRTDLCPGAARRAVENVLEAFAGSRLLVLDGDTVQIAHDVLLRAWPRLHSWLERDQANTILYTQLQEDAAQWAEQGLDPSFLYRGSQLAAVQQAATRWAADPARYPALTQDQSGFLQASRRNAARSIRLRRTVAALLVALLIVSLTGTGLAVSAARNASHKSSINLSGQLAAESEESDLTDPVTASRLAVAAWRISPTAQARESMLDLLAQPNRGILAAAADQSAVAFSPDRKILATAGANVRLWNAATHRQLGPPMRVGRQSFIALAFSPDGKILATADTNPNPASASQNQVSVRLWDVATHRQLGSPMRVGGPVDAVAFGPDAMILATLHPNPNATSPRQSPYSVRLWDVATHRQLGPPIGVDGQSVNAVAFSPNGEFLATAGDSVRLWDVATHRQLGSPIPAGSGGLESIAFSPDGNTLAGGGQFDSSWLWDVATHKQLGSELKAGGVAAFSPSGTVLATISRDGLVRLWDVATHQQLGNPLPVGALDGNLGAMAFSPNGTTLATVNMALPSQFWDIRIYRPIHPSLPARIRQKGASSAAFDPQGTILATGNIDGAIRLWDVASLRQIGALLPGSLDGQSVEYVVFSPDGKILAAAMDNLNGGGDTVRLWDVATGHQIAGLMNMDANKGSTTLAFSRDGRILAAGTLDGKVRLWDLATHRQLGATMTDGADDTLPTVSAVNSVAFSPDGKILATASNDGTARLWDVATSREIGAPLVHSAAPMTAVAFSPDGTLVATVGGGAIQLWGVRTHQQSGSSFTSGGGSVDSVAFAPNGQILASGTGDGTELWDVATHHQIGESLAADAGMDAVVSVAFSPDGKILATTDLNGDARLWDIAIPGNLPSAVCSIAGGSFTHAEWSTYVGTQPFRPICQ